MDNNLEQGHSRLPLWVKGFFGGLVCAFGITFLFMLPSAILGLFFGKSLGRVDSISSFAVTFFEIFVSISILTGFLGALIGLIRENNNRNEIVLQNNTGSFVNDLSDSHKKDHNLRKGSLMSLIFSLPICYWFFSDSGTGGTPAVYFLPLIIIVVFGIFGALIGSAWGNKKALKKVVLIPIIIIGSFSFFLYLWSLWFGTGI